DGKTLAALGGTNAVRLWNPATGKALRDDPGFGLLALSPDGQTLASGGGDAYIRLWDSATGRLLRRVGTGDDSKRPLCFSRDGRALTSISYEDKKAQVWDVATGKEVRQFAAPIDGYVRNYAISPDGNICASDSEDRRGKVAKI